MKRPVSIYLGVLLIVFRVITAIVTAVNVWMSWGTADLNLSIITDPIEREQTSTALLVTVLIAFGFFIVVDALLAYLVFRGHRWARILVMTASSIVVIVTAGAYFFGNTPITLENGGLMGLSLDVLILVALSSSESRDYSTKSLRETTIPEAA